MSFGFDYPALLRGSLLGMVRGLLARVAQEGLPGEHHFFLTFGTREPGVVMSPRLQKQYPEEMTVVLQHQFWNLGVDDEAFQVTLRFGGAPEPVTVPWAALRAFADPSVGFALRLQAAADEGARPAPAARGERTDPAAPDAPAPAPNAKGAKVVDFGTFRRRNDGEA